jgi:hypothetical protein
MTRSGPEEEAGGDCCSGDQNRHGGKSWWKRQWAETTPRPWLVQRVLSHLYN